MFTMQYFFFTARLIKNDRSPNENIPLHLYIIFCLSQVCYITTFMPQKQNPPFDKMYNSSQTALGQLEMCILLIQFKFCSFIYFQAHVKASKFRF